MGISKRSTSVLAPCMPAHHSQLAILVFFVAVMCITVVPTKVSAVAVHTKTPSPSTSESRLSFTMELTYSRSLSLSMSLAMTYSRFSITTSLTISEDPTNTLSLHQTVTPTPTSTSSLSQTSTMLSKTFLFETQSKTPRITLTLTSSPSNSYSEEQVRTPTPTMTFTESVTLSGTPTLVPTPEITSSDSETGSITYSNSSSSSGSLTLSLSHQTKENTASSSGTFTNEGGSWSDSLTSSRTYTIDKTYSRSVTSSLRITNSTSYSTTATFGSLSKEPSRTVSESKLLSSSESQTLSHMSITRQRRTRTHTHSFQKSQSKSSSLTPTAEGSKTLTPSRTPSSSSSITITLSPSRSVTASKTMGSLSPEDTLTFSSSASDSPSDTDEITFTESATSSDTPSISATVSLSLSGTPSASYSASKSTSASEYDTSSFSVSSTLSPTDSASPITLSYQRSATESFSLSPSPSNSREKSSTKSATQTLTVSMSSSFTASISILNSSSLTDTPDLSMTFSVSGSSSSTVTFSESESDTKEISESTSVTASPSLSRETSASNSVSLSRSGSATTEQSVSDSDSVSRSASISASEERSLSHTLSLSVTKSSDSSGSLTARRTPSITEELTSSFSASLTPSNTDSLFVVLTKSVSPPSSKSLTTTPSPSPSLSNEPSLTLTVHLPNTLTQTITSKTLSASKEVSYSPSDSESVEPSSSHTVTLSRTTTPSMSPSESVTLSSESSLSRTVSSSESNEASETTSNSLTYSESNTRELTQTTTQSNSVSLSLSSSPSQSSTQVTRPTGTFTFSLTASPISAVKRLTDTPSVSRDPTNTRSVSMSRLSDTKMKSTTASYTNWQSITLSGSLSYSMSSSSTETLSSSSSLTLSSTPPKSMSKWLSSRSSSASSTEELTVSPSATSSDTGDRTVSLESPTMSYSQSLRLTPTWTLRSSPSVSLTMSFSQQSSSSRTQSMTLSSSVSLSNSLTMTPSATRASHTVAQSRSLSYSPSSTITKKPPSMSVTREPTASATNSGTPTDEESLSNSVTGSPSTSKSPSPTPTEEGSESLSIELNATATHSFTNTQTLTEELSVSHPSKSPLRTVTALDSNEASASSSMNSQSREQTQTETVTWMDPRSGSHSLLSTVTLELGSHTMSDIRSESKSSSGTPSGSRSLSQQRSATLTVDRRSRTRALVDTASSSRETSLSRSLSDSLSQGEVTSTRTYSVTFSKPTPSMSISLRLTPTRTLAPTQTGSPSIEETPSSTYSEFPTNSWSTSASVTLSLSNSFSLRSTNSSTEAPTDTKSESAEAASQSRTSSPAITVTNFQPTASRTIRTSLSMTKESSDSKSLSSSNSFESSASRSKSVSSKATASKSATPSPTPSASFSVSMQFTVSRLPTRSNSRSLSMATSKSSTLITHRTQSFSSQVSASDSVTDSFTFTFTESPSRSSSQSASPTGTVTVTLTSTRTLSEEVSRSLTISRSGSQQRSVTFKTQTMTLSLEASLSKTSSGSLSSTNSRILHSPTATLSEELTRTSTGVPTFSATITPPPTPSPTPSLTVTLSLRISPTRTMPVTNSKSLRLTWSRSFRITTTRSRLPTRSPSASNSEDGLSETRTLTITVTTTDSVTLSRESISSALSESASSEETKTDTVIPTFSRTLHLTFTRTFVPTESRSYLTSQTVLLTRTRTVLQTETFVQSRSLSVSQASRTLRITTSATSSVTASREFISPNSIFITIPNSPTFEYVANRFLALKFGGVPLNQSFDKVSLVPAGMACTADSALVDNHTIVVFKGSSRFQNIHNWTAFPRTSGLMTICYYSMTRLIWQKITLPAPIISMRAAVWVGNVNLVSNLANRPSYDLIVYGANATFDEPYLVSFGQVCNSETVSKITGVIISTNSTTFVTRVAFSRVSVAGDYTICYMGFPHKRAYAIAASGARRIRIQGYISTALLSSSTLASNFKVGRNISYSITGVGLSVRDAFFLTNASVNTTNGPCSMPYHVPGSVRVSWGQIVRQSTPVGLSAYDTFFQLSVPYNLVMCYRSNYSSNFYFVKTLDFPVAPIAAVARKPNMSSIFPDLVTSWNVGGDIVQTFSGEGVDSQYDSVFLFVNTTSCQPLSGPLIPVTYSTLQMAPFPAGGSTSFIYRGLPIAANDVAICYKSNFSSFFNMGPVRILSTFYNDSDSFTHGAFLLGVPLNSNASLAIASENISPSNVSNLFYLLTNGSQSCLGLPPVAAIFPLSRNRTHVTFATGARGMKKVCAVSGQTGSVESAPLAVVPRAPTKLTPNFIPALVSSTVSVDGGVDLLASSSPDVLRLCNASAYPGTIAITPLSATTAAITASVIAEVRMCVVYGLRPSTVIELSVSLFVGPSVQSVVVSPTVIRVGTVGRIALLGYGLTSTDLLFACETARQSTCVFTFVAANQSAAVWSVNATATGSYSLCYRYTPTNGVTFPDTSLNAFVPYDAMALQITPLTIDAERLANVTISGLDVSGVTSLFIRTAVSSCDQTIRPPDALAFAWVSNTGSSLSTWNGTIKATRGVFPVCYTSYSSTVYGLGYITVMGYVSTFAVTQEKVAASTKTVFAGYPVSVTLTGGALLPAVDQFYFIPLGSLCENATIRSYVYGSSVVQSFQTSVTMSAELNVEGISYELCYTLFYQNGSVPNTTIHLVADGVTPRVTTVSSFQISSSQVALLGPAATASPYYRFKVAMDPSQPIYTPLATLGTASSVSMLFMPYGTTLISAELVAVNGVTQRVINTSVTLPQNKSLCLNFPQSLIQSDAVLQFALSFIALYNFDYANCYSEIPANYLFGPSMLLAEMLTLTSGDVSLIKDSRKVMDLTSRIAAKIPQDTSKSEALLTTVLQSSEQSLNIPDSQITTPLLLSHVDIVANIFSFSGSAIVNASSTVTAQMQSMVLSGVNRINLVAAKMCSSGIANSGANVSQDAFSFSALSVPAGQSRISLPMAKGIVTSVDFSSANTAVGCVMSLSSAKNFIPDGSSNSGSRRTFDTLGISPATLSSFNIPVLSFSMPGSSRSNPLSLVQTMGFQVPYDGVPADPNGAVQAIGVRATFYRFSPDTADGTTGQWVLDTAATATADNSTLFVTYDFSKSLATSTSNPKSYFFLSGTFQAFRIVEPEATHSRDTSIVIFVCVLAGLHVVFVACGMAFDRFVDERARKLEMQRVKAPTTLNALPPTSLQNAPQLEEIEDSPSGESPRNMFSPVPAPPTPTASHRGTSPVPPQPTSISPAPLEAIEMSPITMGDTAKKVSTSPTRFVAIPPPQLGRSKYHSVRSQTVASLHRFVAVFARPPNHPASTAARVTSFVSFLYAAGIFSFVELNSVSPAHSAALNVAYGLCVSLLSRPFAAPTRIALMFQYKDYPSICASLSSMIAVVIALFVGSPTAAAVTSLICGVVFYGLGWIVFVRRATTDAQPAAGYAAVAIGGIAHVIVECTAIAYLIYQSLYVGTPVQWHVRYDYFQTLAWAVAFDWIVIEPPKHIIAIKLNTFAELLRQRREERKIKKEKDKEAAELAAMRAAVLKDRETEPFDTNHHLFDETADTEFDGEAGSNRRSKTKKVRKSISRTSDDEDFRSVTSTTVQRHGGPRPPTFLDEDGRRAFYEDDAVHSDATNSDDAKSGKPREGASGRNQEPFALDMSEDSVFYSPNHPQRSTSLRSEPKSTQRSIAARQRSASAPSFMKETHLDEGDDEDETQVESSLSEEILGDERSRHSLGDQFTAVTSEPSIDSSDDASGSLSETEVLRDKAPLPANSRPRLVFSGDSDEDKRRFQRRSTHRLSGSSLLDGGERIAGHKTSSRHDPFSMKDFESVATEETARRSDDDDDSDQTDEDYLDNRNR